MGKDDQTWLNICYVIFGALIGYVAYQGVAAIGVQYGWIERYSDWYQFPMVLNVSAVLAGGLSVWQLHADNDRRDYFLAAIAEIRKVLWPSFEDTKKMTWVVAIVVIIFAIILGIFDILWSKVLQTII